MTLCSSGCYGLGWPTAPVRRVWKIPKTLNMVSVSPGVRALRVLRLQSAFYGRSPWTLVQNSCPGAARSHRSREERDWRSKSKFFFRISIKVCTMKSSYSHYFFLWSKIYLFVLLRKSVIPVSPVGSAFIICSPIRSIAA
jgi:hypothetical protein